MRASRLWLATLALLHPTACIGGLGESDAGECSGAVGDAPVHVSLDPTSSYFTEDIAGWTTLVLVYGASAVSASGTLDAIPAQLLVDVAHPVPVSDTAPSGSVLTWSQGWGFSAPSPYTGTLTLGTAATTRLAGQVAYSFADGSQLSCTFDLHRDAYAGGDSVGWEVN